MKVCWLTNYYSPYKLKLFEELSKEFELTAVMLGGVDDKHRNSEWVLDENHSFKFYLIDKDYNSLIKKLAIENDIFIDSMYTSRYAIKGVSEFKKLGKKTIMYADGGIPIDRGFLFNKLISTVMKRHDYFLSSGPHCDLYYKFYDIEQNILHYKFSSLTKENLKNNKKIRSKKEEIRQELGIDDNFTIVSVGKPIKGKGFDILLDAYKKTGLTDKINLYIVGGEPQEEIKKFVEDNNLTNVKFIGLLTSKELSKYYAMADIFMLCTRTDVWGLVILEAMSYGLPVITSDMCGAGVHFNLLGDNVITCPVENSNKYAEEIVKLYNNQQLVKELGKKSLEIINDYSIENGAQDIINDLIKL